MRRHLSASALILALVCDRAAVQQPCTTATARTPSVAPRPPGAAKREAEDRRRRVDFLDAKTLSQTAAGLGQRRSKTGNYPLATTICASYCGSSDYRIAL
jgi:hypothetical protein